MCIKTKLQTCSISRIIENYLDRSEEKNNNKVGNKYEVLVEEQIEDNVYVGRTIYDAEEIDAIVYVKSIRNLQVGEFVNVVITDALEYDLMGVIEDEFTE